MNEIEYYSGAEFERKICEPSWRTYFDNKLKLEKSIELLKANLDKDDQDTIDLIIERLSYLLSGKNIVYSEEEKQQVSLIWGSLYNKIHDTGEYFQWNIYRLYTLSFDDSVFWYKCGIGAVENLERLKNKDIIDAGAYIGDSSIVLSDYTYGNVYAFEAFYDNYKKIKDTAELNERKNIIPVNAAIAASDKEKLPFYVRTSGETGHGIVKREGRDYKEPILVNAVSLDSFVQEHNLNVGLIKSDIEGGESELIKGAEKTIRSQKPVLLISIYHSASDFFELKRMIEEMNLGYKFKIFRPVSEAHFFLETMLICETQN